MPSRSPTIKPVAVWSQFAIPEQPSPNIHRRDEDVKSNSTIRRMEKRSKVASSHYTPSDRRQDIRNQSLFSDELDSVSHSESTATAGWWQFSRSRNSSISSQTSRNSLEYVENRSPRSTQSRRQNKQGRQDKTGSQRGGAEYEHGIAQMPIRRNNGASVSSQEYEHGRSPRGKASHVKERSYGVPSYSGSSTSGRSTYVEQVDDRRNYVRSESSGSSTSTIAKPGSKRNGWSAADVGTLYYGLSAALMPSWYLSNLQTRDVPDTSFSTWAGHPDEVYSPTAKYAVDPEFPSFVSALPPLYRDSQKTSARGVQKSFLRPPYGHAGSTFNQTISDSMSRADTLSTLSSDNWGDDGETISCYHDDESSSIWSGSEDGFSDTATDSSFDSDIESDFSEY